MCNTLKDNTREYALKKQKKFKNYEELLIISTIMIKYIIIGHLIER